MIYLDTSALIKRFVNEKGSARVESLVQGKGAVATAKIAYAEIFAGLTRKLREGNLSKAQYTLACRQFERDWRAYIRVELDDDILFLARDLIQRRPLRGFDAVHLASALTLTIALGESITFAAADERLLKAAEAENLEFLNVETVDQ
ncbi:MAG TPA: type II toxin-antitoxin system VapC family toxin [Candidatus Binatia bacterium]|nr:type II toxin-antitoxin system VapC family toxin [Candidatus Binatia bacterium]